MCNLHWCYTFCTGVTLFALVLHLNCTALSQSKSSNFFMYIITSVITWLATRAGKMNQIARCVCPLGNTRCMPQAKFHQKPYNKSFIDQVCSVKMAGYWPRSLLYKFQRYRLFIFYHFSVAVVWHHHWSNLHNRKTSISLKWKKDISKRKTPFFCILKGLSNKQKKKIVCHIHFKIHCKYCFVLS